MVSTLSKLYQIKASGDLNFSSIDLRLTWKLFPKFLHWTMDTLNWIVQVVWRPQQSREFILTEKNFDYGIDLWLVAMISTIFPRL